MAQLRKEGRPAGLGGGWGPASFMRPVCGSSWARVGVALSLPITLSITSFPSLWDLINQIEAEWGLGCESAFQGRAGVLDGEFSTWVLDLTLLLTCQ